MFADDIYYRWSKVSASIWTNISKNVNKQRLTTNFLTYTTSLDFNNPPPIQAGDYYP